MVLVVEGKGREVEQLVLMDQDTCPVSSTGGIAG